MIIGPVAFSRLFTVPASSPAFFEIADDLRGNYPRGLIKLLGCDAEVRLTGDQELNNQVFRQVFDFLTSSNMARKLPDDGKNKDFFRWFADAKGDMGKLAINRPGTFIPLYVPRGSPTTYARGVLLLKNPAPRPGYLTHLMLQAVQGMFASELSGFFDLIREKIRSLAFFSIRNGEGFYFPSFLTNRQGAVDYFWLLGFPQEILEEDYFRSVFRSSAPGAEHATLLAIPSPGCPEAVGFPEDDRYLDLVPVVKRMQCTLSQTWSGRLPIRGQPCEVVVRRLPLIRQHYLARVLPVAALEGQLQPIRGRAVLFWLGSVLFGACLVFLLGNRLLRPMRLLEAGIQGIREKRFDTPLPVLSQDELGKLSREFNRTLAHLADMEVASVLQSHLQPIERMTMAGFEIIGRNRMMQAIGGDYFDYFPVGERHLAFILGDVSGHGVSAALVTVMAKAGFTILFSWPENTPQTVMRIVHEVLLETLNKKKMMTCIMGLLEPATGAVLLVNAGQCSPLLISVSEKVEFLEMNASPLGIMKKTRLATLELNLRQKTLLLYSDCLVESRDERDNPVGYPAFQEIIVRLARQSPAWGPDDLFREVRAITGAIPWDDDATVVIIREIPNLPDA